jgi:hypothetical protein
MSVIDSILLNDTPYFEERADYLEKDQLIDWTAKGDHFIRVQKKLIGTGAKLLVGPRGTGKTHHMRCAFYKCLDDESKPLPIYVSFNRYLRLETFLNKTSNAIEIFHTWVLAKIVYECSKEYELFLDDAPFTEKDLKKFIDEVERQIEREEHSVRTRAVLFLDDAALTLTHDYMIEFFDIYRSLKSTYISPKASVYPGTTQYGPRFHIGHDAESVPVWLNVDDSDYTIFMDLILTNRMKNQLNVPDDIMELLKYASFGIPRAFIMMLRDYSESEKSSAQAKYNFAIQQRKSAVLAEYLSIGQKLPQYSKIIEIGEKFFLKIVDELKEHNHNSIDKSEKNYKKTITVGLTDIPAKAKRMIQFLVEAGLLHELSEISHGSDRKLIRYIPHMSILLQARIFSKSRGFNAAELAGVLTRKSEKHPMRRSFGALLGEKIVSEISLDLPACSACKAPRINEKQRFCHNCGVPLVDISAFDGCMKKSILELPLTDFQKNAIGEYTDFETVADVLTSQDPATEFKKADGIGPKYSERIFKKINSWVDEFLV